MSLEELQAEDGGGEVRRLGTLPVEEVDLFCAPFSDHLKAGEVETLSPDDVKKILSDSDRKPARQRYGSEWILDQDGIGACNYYAMCGVLERLQYDRSGTRVPLWASAGYAREVNGADRGSSLSASFRDIIEKGLPPMSTRGGTREHIIRVRDIPQEALEASARFKGFEAYWVKNEMECVTALALGFKMVIALQAGGSYGKLDKYGVSGGGGGPGNHALCLDDVVWDAELGKFKLDQPNSWGTRWADGGRCFLLWDKHIAPCVRSHGVWACRSATADPNRKDLPPSA